MGLTFREPFYKPITEEQVVNGIRSVMGLYFCSEDRIVFWNLKVGTFQESRARCGRQDVWTPHLCVNQTVDAQLTVLAEEVYHRIMSEGQSVSKWRLTYYTSTNSFRKGFTTKISQSFQYDHPKDSGQVLNDLALTVLLTSMEGTLKIYTVILTHLNRDPDLVFPAK